VRADNCWRELAGVRRPASLAGFRAVTALQGKAVKEGFRQSMAWLHTWMGLVVGWVLLFVFVTGTAGYFNVEITRWMQPERPLVEALAYDPQRFALAQACLDVHAAGADAWGIDVPGGTERGRARADIGVWWVMPPPAPADGGKPGRGERHAARLDAATGERLPDVPEGRETGGGSVLYAMHYALHYLPYDWAIRIVGICTMLMLLAIVSGIITHKKIFADFFTFRPNKGQRSWLDAHNLISVTALPFFLMITYSGLVFFQYAYLPAAHQVVFDGDWDRYSASMRGEDVVAGAAAPAEPSSSKLARPWPLEGIVEHAGGAGAGRIVGIRVDRPGTDAAVVHLFGGEQVQRYDGATGKPVAESEQRDKPASEAFQRVLFWLHEGRFAGALLRWLYFLSGLLGCAMIATGLVLWTVKRRRDQDKRLNAGQSVAFGFRLVEALNIGSIVGLPMGVAVYFWVNRLIPADFDKRADWEVHALFIAWGLALLHAGVRLHRAKPLLVWREQLWLACAAFALLPVLNLLTTDRHLGVTLPAGDWVLAGFDLTMLGLGGLFAFAALRVGWRMRADALPKPARRVRGEAVA
jgi:uncharacterized iron-regulated membrane protein